MAVTYEPIQSNTVSGTSTSTITFSSIPSTYTDLVLVLQVRENSTSDGNTFIRFNSDTGTNYSLTQIYGSGSTLGSNGGINESRIGVYGNAGQTISYYGSSMANIMNYSNTSTYKTVLSRANEFNSEVVARINLWRNTSAINRIDCFLNAGNFGNGSTITLYGIKGA